MSDQVGNPPFSMAFVLKTTARHMRRSIDISIRKTYDRLPEFKDDQVIVMEIMKTLDVLHRQRKMLDDFQEANREIFTEKS
jgi:hypothetical protein